MREETIAYEGYRLDLFVDGLGWHIFIYPPGSTTPLAEVPVEPGEEGRDAVVRQAEDIVRQHQARPTNPDQP